MPSSSVSPMPRSYSSRTALGCRLMPTPSGCSSATDSKTMQGTPSWCRVSAAAMPPMPPPAMSTGRVSLVCVVSAMATDCRRTPPDAQPRPGDPSRFVADGRAADGADRVCSGCRPVGAALGTARSDCHQAVAGPRRRRWPRRRQHEGAAAHAAGVGARRHSAERSGEHRVGQRGRRLRNACASGSAIGHRRILHVDGPPGFAGTHQRVEGDLRARDDAGHGNGAPAVGVFLAIVHSMVELSTRRWYNTASRADCPQESVQLPRTKSWTKTLTA